MAFDPLKLVFGRTARDETTRAPLAGDQQETSQRLQVGFFGLATMILLVGLANIIMNSVQQSQATAVPQAAPTVAASKEPIPTSDPLADAGVVPDLPAGPEEDGDETQHPAASRTAVPASPSDVPASPQP